MMYTNLQKTTIHLPSSSSLSGDRYGILLLNPHDDINSENPVLVSFKTSTFKNRVMYSTKSRAMHRIKELKQMHPTADYQLIKYVTVTR